MFGVPSAFKMCQLCFVLPLYFLCGKHGMLQWTWHLLVLTLLIIFDFLYTMNSTGICWRSSTSVSRVLGSPQNIFMRAVCMCMHSDIQCYHSGRLYLQRRKRSGSLGRIMGRGLIKHVVNVKPVHYKIAGSMSYAVTRSEICKTYFGNQ